MMHFRNAVVANRFISGRDCELIRENVTFFYRHLPLATEVASGSGQENASKQEFGSFRDFRDAVK
jgi:hypothetical protein